MIGLGLIGTLGAVIYLVQALTPDDSQSVQLEIAASEISLGSATDQADAIEQQGPILYPDLSQGLNSFYLTTDPDKPLVFYAFSNLSESAAGEICQVIWNADAETFRDCNDATYPITGEGLKQFNVKVDQNNVIVDLDTLS